MGLKLTTITDSIDGASQKSKYGSPPVTLPRQIPQGKGCRRILDDYGSQYALPVCQITCELGKANPNV